MVNRNNYEATGESNTENATFTMSRFFPVSSVKVGNIHANGSGFVDIANNSKTEEEMTSNDTVLVSNETETDIFANETTPQYVLMSHPLLTLNDSSSVLGGKSTLVYLESSPTAKKSVLLQRVVESTKSQALETGVRTMIVNSRKFPSSTMQSVEKLKSLTLSSSNALQMSKVSKSQSSLILKTETSTHLKTSSDVLQSLKFSQQSSILVSEGLPTIVVQTLNRETEESLLESVGMKSSSIQINYLKQLGTLAAKYHQAKNSKNVASTLSKSISPPSSTFNVYSSTEKSTAKEEKRSSHSQMSSPDFSSLQKDNPEVAYSSLVFPFAEDSQRIRVKPQTAIPIRAKIHSTTAFSSKPTIRSDKQDKADVISSGQMKPTTKETIEGISLKLSSPTPTGVLSQPKENNPSPSSFSLMETPTSLLKPIINHIDISLVFKDRQVHAQASNETKPFNARLTHASSGLSSSLVSPTSSAISLVSSKNSVIIKASSIDKDTRPKNLSKIKQERDKIPVITPRLLGIPSLSDVSPNQKLPLTSGFSHGNKGTVVADPTDATSTTVSAMVSSSLLLTTIAFDLDGLTKMGHSSRRLTLSQSQVATEKSTSIKISTLTSLKRSSQGVLVQTSIITSKNTGMSDGSRKKSAFNSTNIQRPDMQDSSLSLTKEVSSSKIASSVAPAKPLLQSTRIASKTPKLLTKGILIASPVKIQASALAGPLQPDISEVKQFDTVTSHQTNVVRLLSSDSPKGQPTTSLHHGDRVALAKSMEMSRSLSSSLLLDLTEQTQTTTRNVIATTATYVSKGNIDSLTSSLRELTESSKSISFPITPLKQTVLNLADAPRRKISVDYSSVKERIHLLSKQPVNVNTSLTKISISASIVAITNDKRSNSTIFTTTPAKVSKKASKVLHERLFSSISTATERSRITVNANLEAATWGNVSAKITTSNSTPVVKTPREALGKVHNQEKVVRTLASGIVSSPIFHHAINHIGELLKNETGIVDSVSRLESLLGNLQRLVVNETRNHLNSSALTSPLRGNEPRGNGSDRISKQVASKLDGISSKLRRISSVLTELQIKRKELNNTVETRSNVERPGNGTAKDRKRNNLIALLLKRLSKLETIIQRKRNPITGSSLAKSGENKHTASYASLRTILQDSTITTKLQTRTSHLGSVTMPSSTTAAIVGLSSVAAQTIEKSIIAPLISRVLPTNQPLTTLKAFKSITATPLRTKAIVSSLRNDQSLVYLQTHQFEPTSTLHIPIQPPNSSLGQTSTSLTRSKAGLVNFHQSTSLAGSKAGLESFHQSASHHLVNGKKHRVDRSKEFTYVTFRNGLEAGIFTESGKVKDMESCVERCYNRSSCHVAFMVEHSCYSIHCYSQKTCEVLPVQTPIITTRVVYLKDRMLKLPYITTKEHKASPFIRDDKNFTITNCAKNVTVLKNMTFLAGMSAGNYTDYGTVDSIQACSNICCSKKVCDAAFMILNNCFTIDCISDKACHAIPSKSRKVNTSIVYFRKTLSTGRPQQMQKKPKVGNQQLCPLLGGIRKGVTFSGGLTAGNFTDHGYFDNFSSCIKVCCRTEACDIAFMVENNCYSVKCAKNRRRCIPVVARPTKFKTFMAIMKASVYSEVHTQASYDLKCAKKGPIQHNLTFKKGIKAGNFTEQAKIKDMSHCIQACCNISSCSAAFMIGGKCYSVACHSKKDCETRAVKSKVLTTVIAFINHTRKGRKSGEPGLNLKQTFTKSILGGHCDITNVQRNVNITGGWKAGKFLRIPDIKNMVRCTEACCDYHGCAAAMFIGQYCYNLVCFKTKGCQLIGSHGGFMIDRFVAVRKNTGNLLSPIMKAKISELTASKEHVSHSFFMEPVQNAGNNDVQSTLKNASSNTRIDNKARTPFTKLSEFPSIKPTGTKYETNSESFNSTNAKKNKIPFLVSSHQTGSTTIMVTSTKTPSFPTTSSILRFYNNVHVGLPKTSTVLVRKQLEHVQNVTRNYYLSIKSASVTSSALSPLFFSSIALNRIKIVSQTSDIVTPSTASRNPEGKTNYSSSIETKNSETLPEETYSFKSDYSLMMEEHNRNRKRTYACTHTFVFNNATLRGGLNAGDVKNEGKVEGMEECVDICCKTLECNVALMLNEKCYIVACSNKRSCEAIPDRHSTGETKVAYVARSKDETELIKKLISQTKTPKPVSVGENKTNDGRTRKTKDLQSATNNNIVRQGSCFRSPILKNVRFKLGRHAGDFKPVGLVKNIEQCVTSCCKENACNAIFMLGSRCHLVSCSNEQDCQTVEAKSDFYQPRVVYLARSEAEVTYLFKLVPKDILENYKGNETDHANATGDGDESAVRRSQLERAESSNSISSTYFEENGARLTTPSKSSFQLALSTLKEKPRSGISRQVTITSAPLLQSPYDFSTTQKQVQSLESVTHRDTSVPKPKTSVTFFSSKAGTLRSTTNNMVGSNPAPETRRELPLPAEASPLLDGKVSSILQSALKLSTVLPTAIFTKSYALEEDEVNKTNTITTNTIINTSPAIKSSVQAQYKIPMNYSIKSRKTTPSGNQSRAKSLRIITRSDSKLLSENMLTDEETYTKETVHESSTRALNILSTTLRITLSSASKGRENAMKNITSSTSPLRTTPLRLKTLPVNTVTNLPQSSTIMRDLKKTITNYQQNGSKTKNLPLHAFDTSQPVSPEISQGIVSQSEEHGNDSTDFATPHDRNPTEKSTESPVPQEQKRVNIARLKTSKPNKYSGMKPQSQAEKAAPLKQTQKFTVLTQTEASEMSTFPKRNQTSSSFVAQTIPQVGTTTLDNGTLGVRSSLKRSLYSPPITSKGKGSSEWSTSFVKMSSSDVTPFSQLPPTHLSSTPGVLRIVITKSANLSFPTTVTNATSIPGSTAGDLIKGLSSQSVIKQFPPASITPSASRRPVSAVNTKMPTPSPTTTQHAILTVSREVLMPNTRSVSKRKKLYSLVKETTSAKVTLISSTAPQLRELTRSLLVSLSLQRSLNLSSMPTTYLAEEVRTLLGLDLRASTGAKVVSTSSLVSVSLSRGISSSLNWNAKFSSLTTISGEKVTKTSGLTKEKQTSSLRFSVLSSSIEPHSPATNKHVPASVSLPPSQSKPINSSQVNHRNSLLRIRPNYTSFYPYKTQELLTSSQISNTNMTTKKNKIPRNGNLQDFDQQNVFRYSGLSKTVSELNANVPNMRPIQGFNRSVVTPVSTTPRNRNNFTNGILQLSDIKNATSHNRVPFRGLTHPSSVAKTPHLLTSISLLSINFSISGTHNTSRGIKSSLQELRSPTTSTLTNNSFSIVNPSPVGEVPVAPLRLPLVPNEVKGNHSSAGEKHKRLEIPFAGGVLDQIEILHSASTLSQQHSTPASLYFTPISGLYLEQITRVYELSHRLSDKMSHISSNFSENLASSETKHVARKSKTPENERERESKANVGRNMQHLTSASNDGETLPASALKSPVSVTYSSTTTSVKQGRANDRLLSQFEATQLTLHSTPLSQKDQVVRSSSLWLAKQTPPIKLIPSATAAPLEREHNKIRTRVLAYTPTSYFRQSNSMVDGSSTIRKEDGGTVKTAVVHGTVTRFSSETNKSGVPTTIAHDQQNGMFGYFAQLLKSIKDILTKKNRRVGETSIVPLASNVQQAGRGTENPSNFGFAHSRLLVSKTTLQQFSFAPVSSSKTTEIVSVLISKSTKALDMSLAMQPLHQMALNVTGIGIAALCKHSIPRENSTLRGGAQSGLFKEVGKVNSDTECISQCCISNLCDAAFLLLNRCFLVTCKSKSLCESVPAKNIVFRPRVIYMENKMALNRRGRVQEGSKSLFSGSQSGSIALKKRHHSSFNPPQLKNEREDPCKASIIRQNVTLRGGIRSGYFRDQGIVKSMQKCVELCCVSDNCTVAFLLLNRCFSVTCYSESLCSTIPARNLIFQPQVAYIARNDVLILTPSNTLKSTGISKTQTISRTLPALDEVLAANSSTRPSDNCHHGNTEKNVTFRGGLSAGSFLDTGVVSDIEECVNNCCHATKCDVAFMIMKRCFLVTCYSARLCQSVPARNMDYLTEMVHVFRDETAVVRDLLARIVQPSSLSVKMKRLSSTLSITNYKKHLQNTRTSLFINDVTDSVTAIKKDKHLPAGSHLSGTYMGSSLSSTPPALPAQGAFIESVIAPWNVNKHENVGLIQTLSMSTRLNRTRHTFDQTITPSSQTVLSLSLTSGWRESVGKVSGQGKQLETGLSLEDEICQSTYVYYNATMRGGINAGVFKDQGAVQNMRKCIEQCCRWQFCSVAFMLLTRCYIIACYNEHLCDPVPARNVTFTPRVAFISRVRRDHGLENISAPLLKKFSKFDLRTSPSETNSTAIKALLHTGIISPSTETSKIMTFSHSPEVKPSPSRSMISKVFTLDSRSRHNCTQSEEKHNVTLRGGLGAGHFKDMGKVPGMQKCINFCCMQEHCDVALMLLENCFTVICHNKRLCESVPAKTGRYKSRMVFVGNASSVSSIHLSNKPTKTISLLDAALQAMGEYHVNGTSPAGTKITFSDRTSALNSKQLAKMPVPSQSLKVAGLKSSEKNYTNQTKDRKEHLLPSLSEELKRSATMTNSSQSHHNQLDLMKKSETSGHNITSPTSSTVRLNASVLAPGESSKSAIEEGLKSGNKSGLRLAFSDSSRHLTTQPSPCLNSPISYNVTLRNGIRSGYFRDQGRVENMSECVQKCCSSEDCDVALLLKQRCYLVKCYTKQGCETVPARHSEFRPRVSHVRRANDSQLISFMDEQETDNRHDFNGKTPSVQPRSSTQLEHITSSSTLPALVKSVDHRRKQKEKPRTSSVKIKASTRHGKRKNLKVKARSRVVTRSSGKRKNTVHVTKTPNTDKINRRKSKKKKQRKKQNDSKREAAKAKQQHFKNKLEKKKDRKLSNRDLDQLFQLMRPAEPVSHSSSKSESVASIIPSKDLKNRMNPVELIKEDERNDLQYENATITNSVPDKRISHVETRHRASPTGEENEKSNKTTAVTHPRERPPSLEGQRSYTSTKGANSMVIKAYNKAKVENSVSGKVKVSFEKKGNGRNKKLDIILIAKPAMKATRHKPTAKEKVTYTASKDLLKHARRPTVGRHSSPTATTARVSLTQKPTVKPPKVLSHNRRKFRATKSTVPAVPTQAPDAEVSSCVTGEVEYNRTLRGGLSSGLFHEVGKVNDIHSCSEHCCASLICDLAFMVLNHCFLVTCSSSNPHMCDSTPALATTFHPMISRVSRSESGQLTDHGTEAASTGKIKPAQAMKTNVSPTLSKNVTVTKEPVVVQNMINQTSSKDPLNLSTKPINTTLTVTTIGEVDQVSMVNPPTPPGCISSITAHNVTLRGGLHAGKFTDAGRVNGSYICTELCCKSDECDVAFFAFHRCFLVKCFDEYLCTSTPSLLPNFKPTVVHVYHHHFKPTPKPATTLPPINDVLKEIEDETQTKSKKNRNKTCAHSEVYEEVTLRMGYKAGNFTPHGKVNSTSQCVDYCCSQPHCDLTFMFLNNCFTVSCISGYACEIVPARQSRFKPKVVYFVKNNSTRVIKPSEFNSSLTDPGSFVGKQPVNAVHYKEVRLNKKNSNSYQKDVSQGNNNTETVDEIFVEVPENAVTSRNKINNAEKAKVQAKFSTSKNTTLILSRLSTRKHLKNEHKLGMKSHNRSQAVKKIDIVLNKLTNVTEENKRLEGEIHNLIAKQFEQVNEKKIATGASGRSKEAAKKLNKQTRKGRGRKDWHQTSRRVDKEGASEYGSGIDSNAQKRVVLVDTDRPPVYPPTDEHRIEEHSIHSFQSIKPQKKPRQKRPKAPTTQKQRNISKSMQNHWDPTNEHDIEEHVIYNHTKKERHTSKPNKKMHGEVQEGSEILYGQPENDKDDNSEKEPQEGIWNNSNNDRKDPGEHHHDQTVSSGGSHFVVKNENAREKTDKGDFYSEHYDDSKTSENREWFGAGGSNRDNLEKIQTPKNLPRGNKRKQSEFHQPKSSRRHEWMNVGSGEDDVKNHQQEDISTELVRLPQQHAYKESSVNDFHIHRDDNPKDSERFSWRSSRNRDNDNMENFINQVTPTHKSHFHFRNQRKKNRDKNEEFHAEKQEEESASENHRWISSSDANSGLEENFPVQVAPFHQREFQFDEQRGNKNNNGEKFHFQHSNVNSKHSGKNVWLGSTRNKNTDRVGGFHDQKAPSHRVRFDYTNKKANGNRDEDEIYVDNEDESGNTETRVWSGSKREEDRMGSFNKQVGPTHKSRFHLQNKRKNKETSQDKMQIDVQTYPEDLDEPVWSSGRDRSKDDVESFRLQIAPTQRSGFQWNDHRKSKDKSGDKIHLQHQTGGEPVPDYGTVWDREKSMQGSLRKEHKFGFTVTKYVEPTSSEFDRLDKNFEKYHPEHSIERPAFVKNDFSQVQKNLMAVNGEGSAKQHVTRANYSHGKTDFDAVYKKINNIYKRLENLLEEHSKKESNATLASFNEQKGGGYEVENNHVRRLEEDIPTPPVSASRPTTRASRIATRTKKVRVVKQYVTDDLGGSGTSPRSHGESLMDYIKTIYSRVQWLYKRRDRRTSVKLKTKITSRKRKKSHHLHSPRERTQNRKTNRRKNQSEKRKVHHRGNIHEEALLKEMRQIYRNMKKLYSDQRKEQRKAKKIKERAEKHQHQRSYIPRQRGTSAVPNGLVTSKDSNPLTSRATGPQSQPHVHETGGYLLCIV